MHDVENYVGVTERRNSEREFALGYTSWWLTLDPAAFAARSVLIDQLPAPVPDSPVMSPDFLANYLALGPQRSRLDKNTERRLPVVFDAGSYELPVEILTTASAVREESAHLPERIIMRKVRDAIDKAKRRMGPIAKEGISSVERRIKDQLEQNRRRRTTS
jgi:hypothetical protein